MLLHVSWIIEGSIEGLNLNSTMCVMAMIAFMDSSFGDVDSVWTERLEQKLRSPKLHWMTS